MINEMISAAVSYFALNEAFENGLVVNVETNELSYVNVRVTDLNPIYATLHYPNVESKESLAYCTVHLPLVLIKCVETQRNGPIISEEPLIKFAGFLKSAN